MKQLKTALFDFDGVVVDTEPIYDLFWNDAAKRYGLGIDNFADIIKGTTLPYILEKYFSGYTEEFRQMVTKESTEYEKTMPLPPMPGSIEFIRMLKEHGVQIGQRVFGADGLALGFLQVSDEFGCEIGAFFGSGLIEEIFRTSWIHIERK